MLLRDVLFVDMGEDGPDAPTSAVGGHLIAADQDDEHGGAMTVHVYLGTVVDDVADQSCLAAIDAGDGLMM